MKPGQQIKLGLSMRQTGYHTAAWRHPQVDAAGSMDINHFIRMANLAEKGLFDCVFMADSLAIHQEDTPAGSLHRLSRNVELDPMTILSVLTQTTKNIGLVCTVSTTYNEPYHVARKFASLDHISKGRAGWNVVTSWSQKEAQNFNRSDHVAYDTRYERAHEFLDVCFGLWNSWEPGAFIRDKQSGIFYEPEKRNVLDHKGKHFSVKGPLTVDRCPQGRPVIVQAGKSEAGQELAAKTADLVFTVDSKIDDAIEYYASVKGRMAKYGRSEDEMLILPGFMPIVGKTKQEAQAKLDEMAALTDPAAGLNLLYNILGDLSAYDLDGPVPEPENPTLLSRAEVLIKMARRNNMTIRQLYQYFSSGRGHYVFVGTPEEIADEMERWIDMRAADGFNITPLVQPSTVQDFVDQVVPILQERGIYRTEYTGDSLRANLGLPVLN